jgi:hypothetical protein
MRCWLWRDRLIVTQTETYLNYTSKFSFAFGKRSDLCVPCEQHFPLNKFLYKYVCGKHMTVHFKGSKVGARIWNMSRINLRNRNKMQTKPWPQPLRKQICARHQLNVRDREGKGY